MNHGAVMAAKKKSNQSTGDNCGVRAAILDQPSHRYVPGVSG
jgi:hypothetical protein